MIELVILLGLLTTLRLQLVALALLAAVLPLGTVLASGLVMFHMHDDVKILMLSSTAAVASIVGALLLARWILAAFERLHASSARLAGGDLGARAPQEGARELAELGASFNQMASAVEELFDARRQLVAWASHDLRTPLASINAMLEALEDGLVPLDRYLPLLRDRVHTVSQLVDDLFELARIDAGALTIDLEDARLDQVIVGCVRAEEQTVEVAVEDSGSGIGPGNERRIFDRFWRADPSRGSDGAGLGLAIAQGLIEAQGGRIWAENRPGGGTRVAFVLPVAF